MVTTLSLVFAVSAVLAVCVLAKKAKTPSSKFARVYFPLWGLASLAVFVWLWQAESGKWWMPSIVFDLAPFITTGGMLLGAFCWSALSSKPATDKSQTTELHS